MTTPHLQNTDRNNSWNPVAKHCDYCHSTAALLFCRNHSAFMCMSCDAKHHFPSHRHAKVWLCEVCEHSPAAITCKADAASLCLTCDRDIHTANPVARRHERISVVPFFDSAEALLIKSATIPPPEVKLEDYVSDDPWILPDPCFGGSRFQVDEFLFNDSDQFLEFESCGIASQYNNDCIVPVQESTKTTMFTHDEIDFNMSSYNKSSDYNTPSLNVSSSIDVGVVPDCSAFSEISYSYVKEPVTIPITVPNAAIEKRVLQMGMDREARVLRYREKRKNRKYQKTVRYASRKAYAEIRPRIKGRFAKRTDTKTETETENIDSMFGADNFIDDEIFGVVPSFN